MSFAAPSFDQAVADMQRKGTQIIFDAMDDGANRKLCDAMARRNFKREGQGVDDRVDGRPRRHRLQRHLPQLVFIAGQSLAYTQTSVPEIAEFRAGVREVPAGPAAAPVGAGGVGAGQHGRRRHHVSMGAAPTRKGLETYLNGLRDYKGNGIDVGLDWGKSRPAAPHVEDCFTIARWLDAKSGWTEATDKFPVCYPDAQQFTAPPPSSRATNAP